jgi:hypothetical protein
LLPGKSTTSSERGRPPSGNNALVLPELGFRAGWCGTRLEIGFQLGAGQLALTPSCSEYPAKAGEDVFHDVGRNGSGARYALLPDTAVCRQYSRAQSRRNSQPAGRRLVSTCGSTDRAPQALLVAQTLAMAPPEAGLSRRKIVSENH